MSGNAYYNIPKISRRAPTLPVDYPPMSPPLASPNNNLGIPSAPRSNASSNDSFVEQAFVDFSDHAFNCDRCYDPLRTHLDGHRLCRSGRHLAASVKLTLRDETRALKRHSRSSSDEAYVRIPKGCEPVQQLLIAMQKGLHISTVSPDVPTSPRVRDSAHFLPSPPSSPRPSNGSPQNYRHDLGDEYSYDSVYYVPARKAAHSDEEARTPRRSRRHSIHESDGHRMRRSRSSGPRDSSAVLGVGERERRPYGLSSPRSSADKVSVDSGYDSNGNGNGKPIPDIRRGSQYAEDMRRRHGITIQPTKSALKKRTSFEAHTGIRLPSSPGKLKGVGFDLGGEYKVPGYD